MKNDRKAGFTLMEVALAVVVVAVGVLGLFALLSTGLDSSSRAVSTTQAAMFADATFNALRARASDAASTNDWDNGSGLGFWPRFLSGQEKLTVPLPQAWEGYGTAQELKVIGNGQTHMLTFRNKQNWNRLSSVFGIPSGTFRYRLIVEQDTSSTRRGKKVTLLIWTGPGPITGLDNLNAIVFYSEFANVGTL